MNELKHSTMQSFNHSRLALLKKYLRLSAERELYTIGQAAFRLNISRNEFQSEFIDKGKVNVLFRNGRQFVVGESIREYVRNESLVKCDTEDVNRKSSTGSRLTFHERKTA